MTSIFEKVYCTDMRKHYCSLGLGLQTLGLGLAEIKVRFSLRKPFWSNGFRKPETEFNLL